jgi:hypothetical protein
MFLRNVGWSSTDYIALYNRRRNPLEMKCLHVKQKHSVSILQTTLVGWEMSVYWMPYLQGCWNSSFWSKEYYACFLTMEKMPRHVQWKHRSESAINSKGKEMSKAVIPRNILWPCQHNSKPEQIKLNTKLWEELVGYFPFTGNWIFNKSRAELSYVCISKSI